MVERRRTTKKKTAPKVQKKPRKTAAVARKTDAAEQKPVQVAPQKATVRRTYLFGVGRRKSAVARVRFIEKGTGVFAVNDRVVDTYFPTYELQHIVRAPLVNLDGASQFDVSARVHGGGIRGQAEAIRLGLSRVLVKFNPALRSALKHEGFLTRDPRVKERKKYGLKRARRAPQWQKR